MVHVSVATSYASNNQIKDLSAKSPIAGIQAENKRKQWNSGILSFIFAA